MLHQNKTPLTVALQGILDAAKTPHALLEFVSSSIIHLHAFRCQVLDEGEEKYRIGPQDDYVWELVVFIKNVIWKWDGRKDPSVEMIDEFAAIIDCCGDEGWANLCSMLGLACSVDISGGAESFDYCHSTISILLSFQKSVVYVNEFGRS